MGGPFLQRGCAKNKLKILVTLAARPSPGVFDKCVPQNHRQFQAGGVDLYYF